MTRASLHLGVEPVCRNLSFYKLWQGRNARNARKTGKKEAYARAVHGVPPDGVLHPPRAGQPDRTRESEWPLVVLKELVDNALDAAEDAEIAPVVSITVKGNSIIIEDNGPGIPAKTIDGILDYSIRVSSREAYVSPTRGAQGNALKTILPMGYVLTRTRRGRFRRDHHRGARRRASHCLCRRSHQARAEDRAHDQAVIGSRRHQDHGQAAELFRTMTNA